MGMARLLSFFARMLYLKIKRKIDYRGSQRGCLTHSRTFKFFFCCLFSRASLLWSLICMYYMHVSAFSDRHFVLGSDLLECFLFFSVAKLDLYFVVDHIRRVRSFSEKLSFFLCSLQSSRSGLEVTIPGRAELTCSMVAFGAQ